MINNRKNERGITLIALVVTIIVLLILAGVAISMLSGENGILNKAADAKVNTDEAKAVEQVKLAVLGAREAKGINIETLNKELGKVGYDRGTKSSTDVYKNDLTRLPADIEIDGVHIAIGKDGNVKKAVWYYDSDGNVTNGKITLNLGDTINYNATIDPETGDTFTVTKMPNYEAKATKTGYESNQTITLGTNPGWMVMGVENGEILIVATTDQNSLSLGTNNDIEKGKIAYQYGVEEINNACGIWGQGKYASNARSIQIEDVDRITGFDKTTYHANQVDQYGSEITYYWSENDPFACNPYCESKHGNTIVEGGFDGNSHNNGFTWFENGAWKTSPKSTTATASAKEKIGTITATGYSYFANAEGSSKANGTTLGNALFQELITFYWIGSSGVFITESCVSWAVYGVLGASPGSVDSCSVSSNGNSRGGSKGLRPVVTIKSDVQVTGSSEAGWTLS